MKLLWLLSPQAAEFLECFELKKKMFYTIPCIKHNPTKKQHSKLVLPFGSIPKFLVNKIFSHL